MILRLSQFAETQADSFRVELSLDNGAPVRTRFQFQHSPQDQEDIRWYLEDYLQYPLDPAPTIAARIEQRMQEIGIALFKNVFQSSDDARDLWAILRGKLSDTRVEIVTEVKEATTIPWELLRDPRTDQPLALNAKAFVRAPINPVQRYDVTPRSMPQAKKIRILLVICRPNAGEDVPFRSVASRIVKSLSDEASEFVQLDVLRPPTFEQLGKTLRQAKAHGEPYHIVHFDGHGTYMEFIPPQQEKSDREYAKLIREILKRLNAITLGTPRSGKHGYLLFENPQADENAMFVDGTEFGKLLVETNVPMLVLNACQSAFAEAPTSPLTESQTKNIGEQVRAFGSLAQEVMDTGVAGVVAMRYVLYVETAKRFVADLYAALAQGQSLGEAVTFGRKQLAINPQREIAYKPINLQDWPVPIVYETTEIHLFPYVEAIHELPLQLPLRITTEKEMTQRGAEIGLPPRPDVGFFGRDETLLALDRAFDSQKIVLLHAFAGSGKTTTAVEFARWYALTGGIEGPIFFSSFEHRKTLTDALNETIGRAFNDTLEQSGVHWLTLTAEQRRVIALQVMRQVPMLWIWDNVEPVNGFPAGTKSAWEEKEQKELKEFLAAARETKAKFLLTSRRDERAWLCDLPRRIIVPPMPMQERVQLARALAEKFGHRITEVEDWRPLLQFTLGNPLTIMVLVGEALRKGLKTREEIGDFIERLRAGEAVFADEQSEERSKSLGASLSYGFENAFIETERKQLAFLHFFQGFVEVKALLYMGDPEFAEFVNSQLGVTERFEVLPELCGLTREAGIALLDRAAEIGLLNAHGGGYYSIHPALPWYFKSLFDQFYSSEQSTVDSKLSTDHYLITTSHSAARAFVEAMGALGDYYHNEYERGNHDVVGVLTAEEANLLHARQLAKANRWWHRVISTMQGLYVLYDHTGHRAEWAALVNDIVPDFVDPVTYGSLAGREEQWRFIAQYRTRLAIELRQWEEAERFQVAQVDWLRKRTTSFLTLAPKALNIAQKGLIHDFAVSLEYLGQIQREQGKADCAKTFEEAIPLCKLIGHKAEEAIIAFNLGHAYLEILAIRDLVQAERWYRRALELEEPRDNMSRAKDLGQLGSVAYERYKEARNIKKPEPEAELFKNLTEAVQFYLQALELLPLNAVDNLAAVHNQLGNIYDDASDPDRALLHYREAIRYWEDAGELYHAAIARRNVALTLAQMGRFMDSMDYARSALREFSSFGNRATGELEITQKLIKQIEDFLRRKER